VADSNDLRQRVRAEVIAALKRLEKEPACPTSGLASAPSSKWKAAPADAKRLMLAFMGRERVADDFYAQIESLSQQGFAFFACFSRSFSSCCEPHLVMSRLPQSTQHIVSLAEQDVIKAAQACAGLVAPSVGLNSAAKLALGISDSMPTWLFTEMLLSGKPAFVATELARATAGVAGKDRILPPALASIAESHFHKLQQIGVRFSPVSALAGDVQAAFHLEVNETPQRLKKQLPKYKREFVTVEDVWKVLSRGQKELVHPRDAVITDEARDYASARGIELKHD
jgi:hypothetical protein